MQNEVYEMKTVVIIGGGITGLSAAYSLHKWKKNSEANVRLILVEAEEALGGKIRTRTDHDFIMETGADSIVTRKLQELDWFEELDLKDDVVYNATGQSFIYVDGQLGAIPADSIFGIPATIESLAKSSLVSDAGKVEALKDFYLQDHTFSKNDSIGDFLRYYLGDEMVEKQISPVLSGVYSGKLEDLSISATLPYLLEYKEKYGSIMKGLEMNREKFKSNGDKKFLSFENGLGTLIDAMARALDNVEIFTSYQANQINRAGMRYRISFTNHEEVEADYIIAAIPASASQALFSETTIEQEFHSFKTSSLISVYMGYDLPDALLPEEGTGFITANNEELSCNACTWTSRKWLHTSLQGNLLVRLFYKSSHPSFATLKTLSEEELLKVAQEDIRKSLQITAAPVTFDITKWMENMPTYQIDHQQAVEEVEQVLATTYPGVKLAGCSYFGVGIPDCMNNGIETATYLIEQLEAEI